MIKRIIIIFFIIISISIPSYSTDEIIEEQKKALGFSSFLQESQNYIEDTFPNLNTNELLNSAIMGKIDNTKIYSKILSIFGKEILNTIKILSTVMIIIIIHALLKSVSENLENNSVSKVTYFVEYILIVTLILKSFSEMINLTKISIQNLVGFSYSLLPILLALVSATRKYCFSIGYTTSYFNSYCFYE